MRLAKGEGFLSLLLGTLCSLVEGSIWINEFHYDNDGSDVGEFIEVGCNVETDLTGHSIVLYNGSGGATYSTPISLDGFTCAPNNSFIVQDLPANGLQNGAPDGIALVDSNDSVLEFISYEGSITASDGPAVGLTSTDIGVSETSSTAIGTSIQRTGSGCEASDFTWATGVAESKGSVNAGQSISCGGDSPTRAPVATPAPSPATIVCKSIQEIQGLGVDSPLVGQNVKICGAHVTKVVNNGFFVQEILSLGTSSNASSGVFVFDTSSFKGSLAEGNKIDVIGKVTEYFSQTQIAYSSSTVLAGSHIFAPVSVMLPLANMDDLEMYEGMKISVEPNPNYTLVVSEYFNFDRYGEVVVCSAEEDKGRIFQFTEKSAPDTSLYSAHQDMVKRSCITIDDNVSSQNPDPALFGSVHKIDSIDFLRGGSEVTGLKGPLWYSFGLWRVATIEEDDLSFDRNTNPREPAPKPVGDITISNTNVLNYFVSLQADHSYARGANTFAEFDRQASKTVKALSLMDTDIVGVQEIENIAGNGAVIDLLARLNVALPSRDYTFASIEAGFDLIGSDVIKVDVMFDRNKFTFLGAAMLTDSDVDPSILGNTTTGEIFDGKSRVPLAVSLEVVGSNKVLTVVANHFKSKGSGPASGLDADQNDGAGNWNHLRTLASRALLAWLSSNPTTVMTDNVILLGDFNAYSAEPPVTEILSNGYSSLDGGEYSYLFSGQWGKLDHVFIKSEALSGMTAESAVWHCNADELDYIDYNLDFGRNASVFDPSIPERFSDHDPTIVALNFIVTSSPTPSPTLNKKKNKEKGTKAPKNVRRRLIENAV